MQDYKDYEEGMEGREEPETHFFCKLTFGQFFTLMVLEIITLCFVFYLGARYGNEYLKLDVLTEAKREPVSIVTEEVARAPGEVAGPEDAELNAMARKALEGNKVDLKKRVEEILARQKGPTAPPVGEPSYPSEGAAYDQGVEPGYEGGALPQQQTGPVEMRQYEPAPASESPPSQEVVKVKSTGGAKFSVQVGSYPDVKEASYRVEEWKVKGYPAYMMIANLGDKGQWYRVRIGAFADKEDAGHYLDDLKEKEGIEDAFVIKNEQ